MKSVWERTKKEIEALMKANNGVVTKTMVADFAESHPSAACRAYFTWDSTQALRKCHLVEAEVLIQRVFVIVAPTLPKIRRFIHLTSDKETGGGYRDVAKVLTIKSQREELISIFLRDLEAFKNRYKALMQIVRFKKLFKEIDRVVAPLKPDAKTENRRQRQMGV